MASAEHGVEAMVAIVRYLLDVSQHTTHERVAGVLRSVLGSQADEVIVTAGQQLIEQGRQQGLEQGLEQGKVAMRSVLLRMLERRFGAPTTAVRERVESASLGDLELWTERLLEADSLEAVFS